jgi:L-ascorbate metabolism protein UlaG (beta-lactamase superfamily)
MIEPALADDALLADIAAPKSSAKEFCMWWLGQSGFLIQWHGEHLLLDPYLSESLTEKYAKTDKPHVRMTRRAVDPSRLNFIQIATSSHNHTDHLDAQTLKPLFAANPNLRLAIPEANLAFVCERVGIDSARPVGLNDGTSVKLGAFTLHGIAAAHEKLEQDERGQHKFLGFVLQFGAWTIYHSGDCVLYDGLRERLKNFEIDLALLPINGAKPERHVAGNFSGREAAQLAKDIGVKIVIPCHYDMFEFNTANPSDEFIPECERFGQRFRVLKCGERWSSAELGAR